MELREATPKDGPDVLSVARRSLTASYSDTDILSEETIQNAVSRWYEGDRFADLLADPHSVFIVAAEAGSVVGFAQAELVEEPDTIGEILWIHVDPDFRGEGIADDLYERVRDRLLEAGADRLKGAVLEDHRLGNRFYESHGFTLAYTRPVEVGGRQYTENVYVNVLDADDWRLTIEPRTNPDGETVYVAYDERETGSEGQFYMAYLTGDRERPYGWFCSACETFDNAMDTMGRVECNVCGNTRKPTRWDAAYL